MWSILVAVLLIVYGFVAEAQQTAKIPVVGYLAGAGSGPSPIFIRELRDLGYVEGQNIAFVFRTAAGKSEQFNDLAAELVRLKVAIIVTEGTTPSLAAKKATRTIPIVMTTSTDPVGTGLVSSFARPGGNITGVTAVTGELGGKLLELLKETVPSLSRVAILRSGSEADRLYVKDVEISAKALGIQTVDLVVRTPDDFENAFRAMTKERAQGLLMRLPGNVYSDHFKRVAELTAKRRLPAISTSTAWVEAGGLMSYGPDRDINYRRAAVYVDKILKGTQPQDLPVEAPMKFQFAINLKTAKQIGLEIPQWTLMKADRVIR